MPVSVSLKDLNPLTYIVPGSKLRPKDTMNGSKLDVVISMPLGSISCPTREVLEPESPRKWGTFPFLAAIMMLLLYKAELRGDSAYIPAPDNI